MQKIVSNSPLETEMIGKKLGKLLEAGHVVCLSGDLGVGKTAFVKGLAEGLGVKEHITSPTFTIVNEYQGEKDLYHFDVYRINDIDELDEIGFDDYIYSDAVSVIEWAEIIEPILPKDKLWVEIRKDIIKGEEYREILITPYGRAFDSLIDKLKLTWSEEHEGTCN